MARRRTIGSAVAILAAVGIGVFVISSVAVSSASSPAGSEMPFSVPYPFSHFTLTGSVSSTNPAEPQTFTLTFATSFTLAHNSPGIVSGSSLESVTIEQNVAYPIPAKGSFVGPVALPFASETLRLTVGILGRCFASKSGAYVFTGTIDQCVTATLTLGDKSYGVRRLLVRVAGQFTPNPLGLPSWTGNITAVFINPGYTFPVATLGSGGSTLLTIGKNGGRDGTQRVTFVN